MKKTLLLLLLLLPLISLSAKETTRVVVRFKVKCTISQPGIFAEYTERYLGIKDAVKAPAKEYSLKDIELYEQGKEPKTDKPKMDTAIRFDMKCLGEEALMATSIPKMAERAAKQIYQLREARTALITGDMTALPDGEALKTMLKRIDHEESELMALFVGKKRSYTFCRDIVITPAENNLKDAVIARFSRLDGVVDSDDYIGEPIYITLTGKRVTAPVLTEKQKKKVYDYQYVKGNAYVKVWFGEVMEEELYMDEVKQFGADIPVL